MNQGKYVFEVLIHGRPVQEYPHGGQTYIEGRKGSNFTLRVRNNTWERVLAVITVDGLSVMNGKEGNYDSGGYVVGPYSSVDIPGWRLDNVAVARFFFAQHAETYAAQMDKPTNIGVIGCAIFQERPVVTKYFKDVLPFYRGDGDKYLSFGGSSKGIGSEPMRGNNIGTGFGEKTEHRVTEVDFKRQTSPAHIFPILYDDREGLTARGVDLRPQVTVSKPNAFPANDEGCTPPPGWRG